MFGEGELQTESLEWIQMYKLGVGELAMGRNRYHSIEFSRRVLHSLNEHYGHLCLSNDQELVTKNNKILLL